VLSGAVLIVPTKTQDKTNPAAPAAAPARQQKFDPPMRLPTDLVRFFSGEWAGAGEFASGKKIEADVSFSPDLDNQWLVYRHTDRAPNSYKALGMWGDEYASKKFIMVINDNFGGARLFSSEGWHDGKIVFLRQNTLAPQTGAAAQSGNQERFTFERQTDETFKMTYEVSKDGANWRMGDYLIFKKKH
jgi:hypothetical protein